MDKINKIQWNSSFGSIIDKEDIDIFNGYIDLYNNLENNLLKNKIINIFKEMFAKSLCDVLGLDLGHLKLDDIEIEGFGKSSIFLDFLRIYKREYLNQEYDRFVYSQFQGLLSNFVQEKGLSKGEYEMFAYMIAEKDKMGELDEIENNEEREVAIMMLINDVFEEFSERFLDK